VESTIRSAESRQDRREGQTTSIGVSSSWQGLPLVYLAGPYTLPDPVKNVNRAIDVADLLLNERVVIPHVPHLTHLWNERRPRQLQDWYDYDLVILARCDALLRLDGESKGADDEVQFAQEHHIPVFLSIGELYEWTRTKWSRS